MSSLPIIKFLDVFEVALIRIALPMILMIALTGCAIKIHYISNPPGATLYENGQAIAPTPYWALYTPTIKDLAVGHILIKQFSARWPNGVEIPGPHKISIAKSVQQFVFNLKTAVG